MILPYTFTAALFIDRRKKRSFFQRRASRVLKEKEKALNVDCATRLKALEDFILGHAADEKDRPIRVKPKSGIIFTNRVKRAKEISQEYKSVVNHGSNISIDYIEGLMSAYDTGSTQSSGSGRQRRRCSIS